MAKKAEPVEAVEQVEQEKQQIRLNVNSDNMKTVYANAFQTHSTSEEVLLSFGINQILPSQAEGVSADMILQFNDRVILNHYTAKRLALSLLQTVREHEERFGVIELDVAKRVKVSE